MQARHKINTFTTEPDRRMKKREQEDRTALKMSQMLCFCLFNVLFVIIFLSVRSCGRLNDWYIQMSQFMFTISVFFFLFIRKLLAMRVDRNKGTWLYLIYRIRAIFIEDIFLLLAEFV